MTPYDTSACNIASGVAPRIRLVAAFYVNLRSLYPAWLGYEPCLGATRFKLHDCHYNKLFAISNIETTDSKYVIPISGKSVYHLSNWPRIRTSTLQGYYLEPKWLRDLKREVRKRDGQSLFTIKTKPLASVIRLDLHQYSLGQRNAACYTTGTN